MRQVMPHRNNIAVRRTKCKIFFAGASARRDSTTWNAAICARSETCERWAMTIRYSHTKQWFTKTTRCRLVRPTQHQLGMAHMHFSQTHRVVQGRLGMTAVDFAAFVERLAQVSSEVIMPFFRSAIGAEDKSKGGVFDPVTEADRAAEVAMRRLIAPDLSGAWGDRRGIWAGPAGRRICLGARSDRRHQELHLRPADLGHADRPDASRPAGLRHDGAAVHPRALFRRRQARALARPGAAARRQRQRRMDEPHAARAGLPVARRGDADDDQPAAVQRRRTARPIIASRSRRA